MLHVSALDALSAPRFAKGSDQERLSLHSCKCYVEKTSSLPDLEDSAKIAKSTMLNFASNSTASTGPEDLLFDKISRASVLLSKKAKHLQKIFYPFFFLKHQNPSQQ